MDGLTPLDILSFSVYLNFLSDNVTLSLFKDDLSGGTLFSYSTIQVLMGQYDTSWLKWASVPSWWYSIFQILRVTLIFLHSCTLLWIRVPAKWLYCTEKQGKQTLPQAQTWHRLRCGCHSCQESLCQSHTHTHSHSSRHTHCTHCTHACMQTHTHPHTHDFGFTIFKQAMFGRQEVHWFDRERN